MKTDFQRAFVPFLDKRLDEQAPLIQVLVGPRQVGKTTGVKQLIAQRDSPTHYASADDILTSDRTWLLEQWQQALLLGQRAILVIDEIQKVHNWPETIKGLWDRQATRPPDNRLRVILLGSSALQIQDGVTESLAGRFELTRIDHWGFHELQQAFGYDLDQYLEFGGYPGAVALEHDPDRWYAYLKESIVETVIGRDILPFHRIGKPALFRQAFEILCHYPAQEISYTKLLGQLQDQGNTDLIKHYIALYESAFMLNALEKYSAKARRRRGSSPKILPGCPALYRMNASRPTIDNAEERGRVFELAVGAELARLPGKLYYWREGNAEVDFIYQHRGKLYAIEVKSGPRKSRKGLDAFCAQVPHAIPIIVTPEHFAQFSADPADYLSRLEY